MSAISNEIYHLYRKGNRKVKDGDAKAERGTMLDRELPVKGTRLQFVMIEAAPAYGLTANAQALLNALFSFLSPEIDFLKGNRALLWAGNLEIMIRAGFTDKKTLNRARDELRSHGWIYYKDSPNKTRSGMRDKKTGAVVVDKTFGIDLTPMRNYYSEILKRIKDYRVETEYKATITRRYKSVKRRIIELFPHAGTMMAEKPFTALVERFEELRAKYKTSDKDYKLKEQLLTAFEKLSHTIHSSIRAVEDKAAEKTAAMLTKRREEMLSYLDDNHPEGGQIAPHNILTTGATPAYSNGLSDKEVVENGADKRPLSSIDRQWATINRLRETTESLSPHKMCNKPSFNQVKHCLPLELRKKLRDDHGFYEMWDLLEEKIEFLGLEHKQVSYARSKMGLEITCGALTVMLDRKNINFPKAFFGSLIKRNAQNELNIPGSLFGIIERRKERGETPLLDLAME